MASLIAKCFVEASPDFIGLISAPETLSFKAGQGIRLSMASTAHPGLLVTALARSRIVISLRSAPFRMPAPAARKLRGKPFADFCEPK
jgi:hypothetical protein